MRILCIQIQPSRAPGIDFASIRIAAAQLGATDSFTRYGEEEGFDHGAYINVDTPNHRPRRVQVTFRITRQFTVDGKQISVEYGARAANSFHVLFDGLKIDANLWR